MLVNDESCFFPPSKHLEFALGACSCSPRFRPSSGIFDDVESMLFSIRPLQNVCASCIRQQFAGTTRAVSRLYQIFKQSMHKRVISRDIVNSNSSTLLTIQISRSFSRFCKAKPDNEHKSLARLSVSESKAEHSGLDLDPLYIALNEPMMGNWPWVPERSLRRSLRFTYRT